MTKKYKKINLKSIMVVYFIIAMVLPLPFIFCGVYYKTNWNNWCSMLLGYSGGAIGGIATLIAIYISTQQTNKIQKENRKEEIKPIFDFDCTNCVNIEFTKENNRIVIDDNPDNFDFDFRIFNLSNYPVKNLKMDIVMTSQDLIDISKKNGINVEFIKNNTSLKIMDNSDPEYGKYFCVREQFFEASRSRRFIFREDEECCINFSGEFSYHKNFFEDLIYQYILNRIGESSHIICSINRKMGKFRIKFSYNDIENNLYSKECYLNVIISFVNKNLSKYVVGLNITIDDIN
ncbi:hypothetical protein [Clostridium sp. 001]|uniref:hypothetical protein n=1 Tax=Clostridium sp. 001 TaxID=1970093 RepID=UPI001C2C5019|nr:hypothetical protein [Clostridium sp. 001]QXE17640.1 hypothetical protein B5S50_01575 [Clostridium sp. 001]